MNATDTRDRICEGFKALSDHLAGVTDSDPAKKQRANADALEREQGRVRAEYAELGLDPPCAFALSITACRELGLASISVEKRDREEFT